MTKQNRNKNRITKKRKGQKQFRVKEQPKITDLQFGATVSGVAAIASLSNMVQGLDVNQRIGNRIYPMSMAIKGTVTASTTFIGTTVSVVRLLVVQDKQQVQATAPTITDVINPANVVGQRNVYFLDRFQIMKDLKIKVDTYNPNKQFSFNLKLGGYIGYGSSAASDITRNGIYLIYLSDNNVNPPTMVWSSRLYYQNA